MKKKGKTALSARLTALCMAALMAFSLMPAQTADAAGETYTKVTSADELTDGRYIMVTDTGYAPGVLDGTWVSAVQVAAGGDTLQETTGAVWKITAEGDQVTLTDSNGVSVKPNGGNNNGISSGEYKWKATFENGKFTFAGQEDDTVVLASNKGSQNKFRAYKTATVNGNPNAYPSEFTLYKADDGGSSSVTVAAPQATPQAGEVEPGTSVVLTTSTAGAQIYFTLDGSNPADDNNAARELYSVDNQPVITADCTLKAAAVLEGVYSAVQTLQYTIAESGQDEPLLQDGNQVVIYAPAYMKALSAEYTGFYNKGTDVTETEDGTLSGYTEKDIWTVKDNGDGTYSFSCNGQNIGMGDSYSSMPLGEKNDKWVLEDAGNGLYYVKNTVRDAYMEWYDSNGNWSAYYNIASGSEGMFALAFYQVTDIPDEPDEPSTVKGLEVEATPKSGASVVAEQKITLEAADGAEIYYTMNTDGTEPADPVAGTEEQKYSEPIEIAETPAKDKPIIVKALAYIPAGADTEAQTGEVYTFTYKAPMMIDDYGLYFGQLHAHTNLSDGTGTVEQAFQHAADVPNLDFLALTDHSNSFEGQSGLPSAGTTHLGDENAEEVNASWAEGREGARAITAQEGDFVGIYGFEMTWSGGAPGHINTFNSEGFENRNAAPYKKGDNYEVLEAYYDTLNANPETISQFNHPGDTFGDFMDFALYDPVIDNQITLIEVGNGEGAIGSSGYFPSYSYYTRALDKGWHVAPTNNQDNHKGNWGDSNTARSVVLSDGLSEEAIYDAMKNYRVYATEDNDLSILYSLNGNAMGSILDEQEKIHITAEISDPTDTAGETKVEVIVNGGQTLAEKTFTGGSATVEFDNLSTGYGYYYLRVTQTDKNIAVTAPVWTGESVNAGISNTSSDVAMPIKGDEIQISSQIFNNLSGDMTVTSLTYTMEGQTEPFHTADAAAIGENGVIGARASYEYSFPYTAEQAGGFNINAELKATIGGEEYTFTDVLKLSVSDPSIATKVLVDGTHYNDYVNGYYSGNMTNFINMGTSDNIQVKIVQPGEEVTADMLEDVALFVISAPLKYTSDYTGDAQPSTFEDSFIQVVSEYVKGGGRVVVCGLADYQDANSGLPYTSYAQVNALLEGIGSTMRINDDELIDQDENGGQPYRLYFDDFNYESTDPAVQSILAGVKESGLAYSSYSGCSVSVGEGEAIVYGHDTTYSINSKAPAQGHDKPVLSYSAAYDPNTAVVQKGDVVSMATEAVGEGRVYACGTVFCSNFEVAAEDQVSYANGIMAQNLLSSVKAEPVISTIQEARAGADGEVFTVVGTVANGTAESGNAFFNTIYIQDEEGNGINVFPIDDSNIRRGDQVQVTGSVSGYIGDKQLSAINVTVLEGNKDVVITDTTTKEANDYETNFGKLVRVKGEVTAVTMAGGIVESITVQDDSGEACRVFIDGYITYSDEASQALEEFVKEGAYISAVGFVSHDAEGNRLRVRDRSEILPAEEGEEPAPGGDQPGSETDRPGSGQQDGNTQTDGSQTGNGAQQAGAAVKDPVSAAQTGDNASVGIRIAIAVTAVLAAGAAAVVIVVGKRRRQRES
ncbi:MAG TPA: CehA/McbA family metallohydrolase [Candidatus Mediterraneibacter excrementavium]|nr:CehA/McbA family metallohydrolase [Candidatus Mediterraneibacter excrementavium]